MSKNKAPIENVQMNVTTQSVQQRILVVRGQQVLMDFQLAQLYGVETRVLKQAVRRNLERFPEDFMFRLTQDEAKALINNIRSQFVMLEEDAELKRCGKR